jgi:hypothetical protein
MNTLNSLSNKSGAKQHQQDIQAIVLIRMFPLIFLGVLGPAHTRMPAGNASLEKL